LTGEESEPEGCVGVEPVIKTPMTVSLEEGQDLQEKARLFDATGSDAFVRIAESVPLRKGTFTSSGSKFNERSVGREEESLRTLPASLLFEVPIDPRPVALVNGVPLIDKVEDDGDM
jgi:hypothetical protein